jgi:hypothetical protein
MDLQRTDTRRQIHDPLQAARIDGSLHPFHQRMCAKSQIEIEHRRAILNQQILVARLTIHYLHLPRAFRNAMQDGIAHYACLGPSRHDFWWLEIPDHHVLQLFQRQCLFC